MGSFGFGSSPEELLFSPDEVSRNCFLDFSLFRFMISSVARVEFENLMASLENCRF
jgi:hypothetical protein